MKLYCVILFHTTSSAMRAEKLLVKEGCNIKLIPTPREFSSDCGIAIRFDWDDQKRVQSILEAARIDIDAMHQI